MNLQVLSLLIVTSVLGFTSCNNGNPKADATTPSWRFPVFRGTTKGKVGRQMPPPPEPDAVLINVGQNGQPRMPEGGFPGLSGGPPIYGAPRDPSMFGFPSPGGWPSVFGIPQRPGVFGIPQGPEVFRIPQDPDVSGIPQGPGVSRIPQGPDVSGIPQGPGVFGMPRLPGFPDTFAITGFHTVPRNLMEPGVYGPPEIPNGPGMIVTRLPPTLSGSQTTQTSPGFILRTRIFTTPGGPLQPGDLEMFGRGVFVIAGNGNIPFPDVPKIFYPGIGPNTPGWFPGVFYSEAPTFPGPPRGGSGANFPGQEGAGGREINDEPTADSFPLIEAPTYSRSS